jgi:hypothetical protein
MTFQSLASCHLLLLKIRSFLLIQMTHIVTPLRKVQRELNFLTLLGRCLMNNHCSNFKTFLNLIVFRGSQSSKKNEKASSHALIALE